MKCTLCDERHVAEPAYYCDKSCQKNHWPEHKALHARLVQQLKRMADRAVAASPDNDFSTLQMRIKAYLRTPTESSPVDDLRQLLRDVRALLARLPTWGSSAREQNLRLAAHVEAELRKRIAANLAALKLADD